MTESLNFHLERVMNFATPEASWIVAGGEARNERNHRIARKEDLRPGGRAGMGDHPASQHPGTNRDSLP